MSTHESGEKKHLRFGEKIKGAAHVVHGVGEDIRGSVMGAFETVSGSEETKAKHEEVVAKGLSEIERGAAQMKGVAAPGSTAGPESHVETKTGGQPEQQPAKQEAPGPTPAPPPSPTQTRQAEPEPSRQEPTEQTKENVQKSGQEDQAASETKPPQTGDKGADAPQGPGSSV